MDDSDSDSHPVLPKKKKNVVESSKKPEIIEKKEHVENKKDVKEEIKEDS